MSHLPESLADRYRRFKFRHFEPNIDQYADLANHGQSPEVMVVSCCDSRVDPETIFSAMPGELFVVRNVANLVPPYETTGKYHGVSAALEFAVLNLRVKHILVLGHSNCGGIGASLDHGAARQTEALFITHWMSIIDEGRDRVQRDWAGRSFAEMRTELEREAVRISIDNLRTFPFIQQMEAKGRLQLHGARFDIASGTLHALNQATQEFVTVV